MRVFTDDEKKLLNRIQDGSGRNLYSLIDLWIKGVSFEVDTEQNSVTFIFELVPGLNLIEKLEQIQTIVIQSVNLIKLFEDKGYIFTFENANERPENPFTFGQAAINSRSIPYRFPDPRISKMFAEYSTREIFITPELGKFIEDKFSTREELRANRQWITTLIALIITFLALVLNIVNTFNKCSNSDKQINNDVTSVPKVGQSIDTTFINDTSITQQKKKKKTKSDTLRK